MPDILNGKVVGNSVLNQRIKYIECACTSTDHVLRIVLDRGDPEDPCWPPELHTEVQLADHPRFLRRVWQGIKYIFGVKSRYGHWDFTIINHDDVPVLRSILDEYDKLVSEFESKHE